MSSIPPSHLASSIPKHAPKLNRGRITFLLLGSDLREDVEYLSTDVMMVVSIEPATKSLILLSVPRDIYVKIPTTAVKERVNAAYRIGEEVGYCGGGGRLAADTLETLLGIQIDHYVMINFAVFHAIVNAIGPIRVCPRLPIYDDTTLRPGSNGDIFDFPAGCQDLDAKKLLQYAQVRYNAGGDFGRIQRQQEIIKAVRAKILTPSGLTNLTKKLPYLWRTVKAEIRTDMSFVQMCEIAEIAATVSQENIYSAAPSVQNGLVLNLITADHKIVLVASTKLREKVQELFEGKADEIAPGTADERLNGSNQTWYAKLTRWGRAALVKRWFQSLIALSMLYRFVQSIRRHLIAVNVQSGK